MKNKSILHLGRYILLLFLIFIAFGLSAKATYSLKIQSRFDRDIPLPLEIKDKVIKYSKNYNLDPKFVYSVIYAESRFNIKAKNKRSKCYGLMQLHPKYWGGKKIYDVDYNIKTGCKFLSYLIKKYKDKSIVLACYNAGEYKVKRRGIGKETLYYITEIFEYENKLGKII